MATLSVGGTTVFDGSALQSGVTFPTGTPIKIYNSIEKNQISMTANTNIVVLTAPTISPASNSSKFMITASVFCSTHNNETIGFLYKGGSELTAATSTSSHISNTDARRGWFGVGGAEATWYTLPATAQYLDSPGTGSDIIYTVVINSTGSISYLNRSSGTS